MKAHNSAHLQMRFTHTSLDAGLKWAYTLATGLYQPAVRTCAVPGDLFVTSVALFAGLCL